MTAMRFRPFIGTLAMVALKEKQQPQPEPQQPREVKDGGRADAAKWRRWRRIVTWPAARAPQVLLTEP